MKKATAIKKFQFFEIDEEENVNWEEQNSQFENIYPYSMYAFDNMIFVAGEKKIFTNNTHEKKYMIFRVYKGNILNSYEVYNKRLTDFVAKEVNNKLYFFTNGLDMNTVQKKDANGVVKSEFLIKNSIKIFEVSELLSKNNDFEDNPLNYYLVNEIIFTMDPKTLKPVFTSEMPADAIPQTSAFSLAVSNDLKMIAIGYDRINISLLTSDNFVEHGKKFSAYQLKPDELSDEIKNLRFDTIEDAQGLLNVLYGTNSTSLFAFTFLKQEFNFAVLNADFGALSNAISTENGKMIMATASGDYIMEYVNLEKGPSWFIEGNKKVYF